MSDADAFLQARPRLFGVAYRMLGSAAEAEDVVQDAWLRWQTADRSAVADPVAYLVTTTTRLAINAATSARARRETYVGSWLPEPVDTSSDPTLGADTAEALDLAVLVLLEALGPAERAAYVLREAFDCSYAQIAEVLGVREDNARQIAARARKHVAGKRRSPVSTTEHERFLRAFVAAAQQGDRASLEQLLAADVVSTSDGGGLRGVARVPVGGRDRVATFVAAFADRFWLDTTVRWCTSNVRPAALVLRDGVPEAVASLEVTDAGIERIDWIMAPAKLARWAS